MKDRVKKGGMLMEENIDIHLSGGVLMTLLADAQIRSRIPVTLSGETMYLNEGNLFLSMRMITWHT